MQVERPASAKIDKTEEELVLEKFSILLIFLLVMSTQLERDKQSRGAD